MDNRTDDSELTLVHKARDGDRDAVQRLLQQNWRWLKGLVLGILHRWEDVDDVLQEICVRVIDKIDTLRDPTRFRAWLASLARREAIKWSQKQARHARAGCDTPMEAVQPAIEHTQALEQAEQVEQILRAARRLPQMYRECLFLQYSQELTYKEMAEVLDIPVTTVQIRLVRARRMIMESLTQEIAT